MSWFKSDDGLFRHRKVRRVLRHARKRRDAAPMGLWVLAGTWSAAAGTGGFVPSEELDRFDDEWEELAARLVDAGLWEPAVVDGEEGYVFHDWSIFNPDAASVKAKQAAESEGGQRGNHLRWHVNRGVVEPSCPFCLEGSDRGDRVPDSGGEFGTRVGPESSVPSRPVPNRPVPSSSARASNRPVDNPAGLTDDDLDRIAEKVNGDRAYARRLALDIFDRAAERPRKPLAYVLRAIAAEPERYRRATRVTRSTECPTHEGQLATACGGCAADALEVTRAVPATQVGTRIPR